MRLIVTGASGLLGGALVYLGRKEADLLALSRRNRLRPDGFQSATVDLLDEMAVRQIITRFAPDWICHCAALTNVDFCERHPDIATEQNVQVTEIVSHASAAVGARLLVVSTDSVFDGTRGGYVESDSPQPLNAYARSKLEAEKVACRLTADLLIVRTNLYGWNLQFKQSLAEWILAELRAGARVPGWEDVFFTPLFSGDLAAILLRMMFLNLRGLFHVPGRERCSKFEFGRAIAEVWGLDPSSVIPTAVGEMLATRPRDTSLRSEKLRETFTVDLPDLRTGLVHMRSWESGRLPEFKRLLA